MIDNIPQGLRTGLSTPSCGERIQSITHYLIPILFVITKSHEYRESDHSRDCEQSTSQVGCPLFRNNERKEVAYRALVEKIVLGIGKLELLPAERIIVFFSEKYFCHPSTAYKRIAIELFEQIVRGIRDCTQ